MEIVIALGIICVIVLLGFAALVFLKHSQDRALLKDLLDARQEINQAKRHAELASETAARMANKLTEALEAQSKILDAIKTDASGAKIASESILKEYELNGIPTGYIRGQHFDAIEGL